VIVKFIFASELELMMVGYYCRFVS